MAGSLRYSEGMSEGLLFIAPILVLIYPVVALVIEVSTKQTSQAEC